MSTLAANSTVTLALTDYDSVTISCRGPVTVEAVSGLGLTAGKIAEFQGTRTFGPFTTAGSLKLTTQGAAAEYEAANGAAPGVPAQIVTDPATGAQSLVGAGGVTIVDAVRAKWGRNRRGFPLCAAITAATGLTVVGQTSSVPVVTYIERDGMKGVRIVTAVGLYAEVSAPTFSKSIPKGQVEALMYLPDGETAAISATALYIGDAAYANSFVESILHSNAGCNQHPGYYTISPDPKSSPADTVRQEWAVAGGAPDFATTTFTQAKIRITPTAAMSATVEIFGIWANGSNTLPSVVFTADDGYDSAYSLGIPVLEKYGHRLSMAIIGDLIGTAGYMTTANLAELVGRGHECVAHGPIGGPGNMTQYTTAAQIAADGASHRNFILANGLAKNGSENVYVYPQGVYQHARDDTRIMDGLRAAGFKYARLANINQSSICHADQRRLPFYLPIIGHTWASSGTEVANIARIIAVIQEAATQGRSVVIMYHKFTAGAAAAAIELQASNLELIHAAVADLEAAGAMKNSTLTEFFQELDGAAII